MIIENIEPEIWKDILGYEGIYQISNYGKLKSLERFVSGEFGLRHLKEKYLSPFVTNKGYLRCTLNGNHFFIHKLVGIAFLPFVEGKPYINHKDGIKKNNFYKNIEWCTQLENNLHCIEVLNKKMPNGENAPKSKLTELEILKIRSSPLNGRQLAKEYNVCFQTISEVILRKTWKHV